MNKLGIVPIYEQHYLMDVGFQFVYQLAIKESYCSPRVCPSVTLGVHTIFCMGFNASKIFVCIEFNPRIDLSSHKMFIADL